MKILFVCTGNTCRSPIAESIFNEINELKNHCASSAGIATVHGSKASKNSVLVVDQNLQKDISERKAVQLTEEMLSEADLVLTMTSSIANILIKEYPKHSIKICSLSNYINGESDVFDPYGGSVYIYNETFDQLKGMIIKLIKKIKEDEGK
ncbi:low molecular weight protein arginine phosphatase [Oceanirhabdus sp. W0125-5]|uniref:low molecular weight protein arginine phosphatase n=1 Tax=Oceanirhabdus sp. W0125-5 TaxID=2999116 RepID=UPI0022F2D603|nr:low molecular weight protein arginine phosphatase [Oceanirhabdus sp. W0125-5]WBW98481.1 low molecular weight protein arginine phosphatase [Oceanirhabdus sp. W0125-5]